MTVAAGVVTGSLVVWGGGSAEALSQTVSLMWYDFAHLRGWCEVTRLDPTGKG